MCILFLFSQAVEEALHVTQFKCPLKCRLSSSFSDECRHCLDAPSMRKLMPSQGYSYPHKSFLCHLTLESLGIICFLSSGISWSESRKPKRFYQNSSEKNVLASEKMNTSQQDKNISKETNQKLVTSLFLKNVLILHINPILSLWKSELSSFIL